MGNFIRLLMFSERNTGSASFSRKREADASRASRIKVRTTIRPDAGGLDDRVTHFSISAWNAARPASAGSREVVSPRSANLARTWRDPPEREDHRRVELRDGVLRFPQERFELPDALGIAAFVRGRGRARLGSLGRHVQNLSRRELGNAAAYLITSRRSMWPAMSPGSQVPAAVGRRARSFR